MAPPTTREKPYRCERCGRYNDLSEAEAVRCWYCSAPTPLSTPTPAPAWLDELSHLREAAEHGLVHDMGHLLNLLYDHSPELLSLARKHYEAEHNKEKQDG